MEKFRIIYPAPLLAPYIKHYWLLESDDIVHSQRIFHEYIGLNPKEFMRVVRFHKALFILQNDPSMNFTRLTYECGYYDQSHLIREFKQFAGYTPREYMAACSPHSDYFSY